MEHSKLDSIENAELKGKRVLMRVDVNVPFDEHGNVRDHQRIIQILPTINYILYSGAKQLILMSHHGRPHGKYDPKQSLQGVANYFREELAYDLYFIGDCVDIPLPDKKLILLENTRFNEEEEANDQEFAKKLAERADIYVNDAFGSYQAHVSVVDLPKYLPSYFGFLYQKEIEALNLENLEKPFILLIGGDKASTKLPLIKKISEKTDKVLVGGVLIFYILKAMGHEIGKSKFTPEYVPLAKDLIDIENVVMPLDIVVAKEATNDAETRVCKPDDIQPDEMGLDIGPETYKLYKEILSTAKTIIWNGPMGLMEIEQFAKHTDGLARHIAVLDAMTIAGGGDSISVINKLSLYHDFTYVSTGGGATLEYLRKGTLPAIEAQEESNKKFKKVNT